MSGPRLGLAVILFTYTYYQYRPTRARSREKRAAAMGQSPFSCNIFDDIYIAGREEWRSFYF